MMKEKIEKNIDLDKIFSGFRDICNDTCFGCGKYNPNFKTIQWIPRRNISKMHDLRNETIEEKRKKRPLHEVDILKIVISRIR